MTPKTSRTSRKQPAANTTCGTSVRLVHQVNKPKTSRTSRTSRKPPVRHVNHSFKPNKTSRKSRIPYRDVRGASHTTQHREAQ